MANIDLSFSRYVAARKGAASARIREGALYAYGGDLRVRSALDKLRPVTLAIESSVRFWQAVGKNKLLERAVRVSERQFPKVHALAARCGKALQVPPPTVYVSPQLHGIEARTFGGADDAMVVIAGSLMDHLSEAEQLFALGRECGHIQNGHATYLTAMFFLEKTKNPVIKMGAKPAGIALLGWSRRAEITADRAGLLACLDLGAARSTLVKGTLGTGLFKSLNVDDYLQQLDEAGRGLGRLNEFMAKQPHLPKRVRALELFAETNLYRSVVGTREGAGISKEECDAKVSELLAVLR